MRNKVLKYVAYIGNTVQVYSLEKAATDLEAIKLATDYAKTIVKSYPGQRVHVIVNRVEGLTCDSVYDRNHAYDSFISDLSNLRSIAISTAYSGTQEFLDLVSLFDSIDDDLRSKFKEQTAELFDKLVYKKTGKYLKDYVIAKTDARVAEFTVTIND